MNRHLLRSVTHTVNYDPSAQQNSLAFMAQHVKPTGCYKRGQLDFDDDGFLLNTKFYPHKDSYCDNELFQVTCAC